MILEEVFFGIISKIDVDVNLYWEALLSAHIREYQSMNNKHKILLGGKFLFP